MKPRGREWHPAFSSLILNGPSLSDARFSPLTSPDMSPCLPQPPLCALTIRHYPLPRGLLILYAPFFKYADIVHL